MERIKKSIANSKKYRDSQQKLLNFLMTITGSQYNCLRMSRGTLEETIENTRADIKDLQPNDDVFCEELLEQIHNIFEMPESDYEVTLKCCCEPFITGKTTDSKFMDELKEIETYLSALLKKN